MHAKQVDVVDTKSKYITETETRSIFLTEIFVLCCSRSLCLPARKKEVPALACFWYSRYQLGMGVKLETSSRTGVEP